MLIMCIAKQAQTDLIIGIAVGIGTLVVIVVAAGVYVMRKQVFTFFNFFNFCIHLTYNF
jgi:hypothetical protein